MILDAGLGGNVQLWRMQSNLWLHHRPACGQGGAPAFGRAWAIAGGNRMMQRKNGFRVCALMALSLVAGCATAPTQEAPPRPGDPYDIQASATGKPQCFVTTAAENTIGAAATNGPRRRAGLAPVTPNATLARAAQDHACDMAARGRMAHHGSKTSGPAARVKQLNYAPQVTAENIAAGPFDLNRVLAEWNASRGHLDNILIPQMRHFGIGRALGADGRTQFWSAVYAAPK